MGFYINEQIETKLNCKEISYLCMIVLEHLRMYGDKVDGDVKNTMQSMTQRLFKEMYNNTENYKPNSH